MEKFIGDAVMGVFGAPVAHGDDPERAVRAALRIREAVAEMNAQDPRLDLQVRMAVNTGEAIVALDANPTEGEGMVAGDVVNTASRLQSNAPVDSILVGDETYRCTRSTIEYEPVDPIAAKGKQLPVTAWRVIAASSPPGERRSSAVPMIGREQELATLESVWRRVVDDRQPHLVTIFGLPGVGKTRLAQEFVDGTRAGGARVVVGRALPYGESGAYGAFAQQVKQVAGIFDGDAPDVAVEKLSRAVHGLLDGDGADEVATHVGMLLGLASDGADPDASVNDRHVLFFSTRRLVEALGHDQPTVLVFQDLHWADPSLLDLIEILAARVDRTRLLLLTLARPELQSKRPGWGSGVQASVVLPLEPLTEEHARELATRLLEQTATDAEAQLPEDIGDAAEGNPLFIEELVASLVERSSPAGGELPSSIRGIIAARLDAVPAAERSVLLDASVVGRIFWNGALDSVGGYGSRLPDLLDSLEGRDLIRREPTSRYQGQQQVRSPTLRSRGPGSGTRTAQWRGSWKRYTRNATHRPRSDITGAKPATANEPPTTSSWPRSRPAGGGRRKRRCHCSGRRSRSSARRTATAAGSCASSSRWRSRCCTTCRMRNDSPAGTGRNRGGNRYSGKSSGVTSPPISYTWSTTCWPRSSACWRTVSSSGASYTQNDFRVPSLSTTTWLCSHTISGNFSIARRLDRRLTLGNSSSPTSYVRSITYLGILPSLPRVSAQTGLSHRRSIM